VEAAGDPPEADGPVLADADDPVLAGEPEASVGADDPVLADADDPVLADADDPVLAEVDGPVLAEADDPVLAGEPEASVDADDPVLAGEPEASVGAGAEEEEALGAAVEPSAEPDVAAPDDVPDAAAVGADEPVLDDDPDPVDVPLAGSAPLAAPELGEADAESVAADEPDSGAEEA
jgi:hypothetical protein